MKSVPANELKRITEVLLKPENKFPELTVAIEDLYQLFLRNSGFEKDAGENREDIHLPGGKAIGPFWAAQCIKESLRTKRFLRGLFLAIQAAQQKFPAHPIHVVYAGTGPFATLAIPLTTVFSPEQVNFTFLEINPASIRYLKRIVTAFAADRYIKAVVECDATTYRMNPNEPIHLIVSETMQNALQKEPQVAIALNLIPQLVKGGIFIPQNIGIEMVLLDNQKNLARMTSLNGFEEDYYLPLGRVFELNKDTPKAVSSDVVLQESLTFPEVEIEIPPGTSYENQQLCLFTDIQVFGEERLTPFQCSLTMPKAIKLPDHHSFGKVRCRYRMGSSPGFQLEFL